MKQSYENKCRDADKAEENNNRLTSNPQTKPKELTQAARKMEVTKQSASTADTIYQESVRNLEEARHLWEREMEVLCKVGQSQAAKGRGRWVELLPPLSMSDVIIGQS